MAQTNVSLERFLFELMKDEKYQTLHISCGFNIFFLSFHKIFRLRLVLIPVSTSGKIAEYPLTVLYQKPLQWAMDLNPLVWRAPRPRSSVPETKENTQNTILETERGIGGICVCASFFICIQTFRYMSDITTIPT